MKLLFTALLIITFWCGKSQAAICIGNNCVLIDYLAKKNGTTLDNILNEVQGNIIDPIVNSQSNMAMWDGGLLDVTPAGSNGNAIKLTLWGVGTWKDINISGNIFSSSYSAGYNTGVIRVSGGVEIPISYNNDIIVNLGLWNGRSDYGLEKIDGNTDELSIRFGFGNRFYFIKNNWVNVYFINGIIIGSRKMSAKFPGTNVLFRTYNVRATWQGEETYDESISYLSLPTSLGINFKFWNLTLSFDAMVAWMYQTGFIEVNKRGPVGPFIGQNDFYIIGINSGKLINNSNFWPIARVGLEWNIITDLSVNANWNPQIGKYPQHLGGGISWQF